MRQILLVIFFTALTHMHASKLKEGVYRGLLYLNEQQNVVLPFNFDISHRQDKWHMVIHNADEKIEVDEITVLQDSVVIKLPVFDTEFRAKLVRDGLDGVWINHYRKEKNQVKFKAVINDKSRFVTPTATQHPHFEGKWAVTFSPGLPEAYSAIGLFHHTEQSTLVHGTFLTETGDYRYLEGSQIDNKLFLSCFDGSHAFLFVAEIDSSNQLHGTFFSGSHWKENWIARKDDKFELKKADEITSIVNPQAALQFSFVNLENKPVSLNDSKFQNKAVLVQIMGSWCPNCMDESAMLAPLYEQYKDQGLEIIALAFEKTNDTAIAKKQLLRLQKRFSIGYDILITGLSGKTKASEIFPMLSDISAFPTLIYLDKKHKIVSVHTGFSGPATGKAYAELKNQTESLIKQLIHQ